MNTVAPAITAPTAPGPTSAAPGALGESAGAGFAQCLDEVRAHPQAPEAPPATPKSKSATAPRSPSATAQTAETAETAEAAQPPEPASAVPIESPAPSATEPSLAHDPAASPDLASLLPGWVAPVAASPPPATAPAAADDAAAALGEPLGVAATPPRSATAARVLEAVAAGTQRADAARAPAFEPRAAAGAKTPAEPDPLTPTRTLGAKTTDPVPTTPLPTALYSALPAGAIAAPGAPSSSSAATAFLAAPPGHPDFAPALATQVRWWAQDGVQQAQLTLNPAELGPVTVRIVVNEAREARIDFSADVAATRGAIEAALPVLAAALDESGLKLSGGGVHDGAAQRQAQAQAQTQGWLQRTRAAAVGPEADGAPAGTPRTNAQSGRLHLVA